MKFFSFLTVLLFTAFSYSQTTDHAGYYITNAGVKVEGYFKQTDFFKSNMLKFKSSEAGEYAALSTDDIKEYGIGSTYKFIKQTVKIDKTDNYNSRLYSSIKDPQFTTETYFLNVLVEGQHASLYSVEVNKSMRYFYTLEDKTQFSQLIYKKYSSTQSIVSTNTLYKKQLFTDINCKNEAVDKFNQIAYERDQLVKLFIEHNQCRGNEPIAYSNKGGNEIKFLYTVFAGVYSSTLGLKDGRFPKASEASLSYGIGGEIALAIPSRTWEIFFRGEFEVLNLETRSETFSTSFNHQTVIANVDATVISGYVGARYNIILKNQMNKLFLDAAIGLNNFSGDLNMKLLATPFDGTTYTAEETTYSVSNASCFNFGAGYVFNDKFGVRLMYETIRKSDVLTNLGYHTYVGRMGLNLRYTLN